MTPIDQAVLSAASASPASFAAANVARGRVVADVRLLAVRELMKYEMPDRWSDVIADTVTSKPPSTPLNSFAGPKVLSARPALSQNYLRRYRSLKPSATATEITLNQGAECLYMTVMQATGDGEARTLFSKQDIDDTDGDGAPEFIDGWGQPITWLRWAPGFISDLQPRDPVTGLPLADADHDPVDIYRRDQAGTTHEVSMFTSDVNSELQLIQTRNNNNLSAYRLTPLIFSRGADGESGINSKNDNYVAPLDPYFVGTDPDDTALGTIIDRSLAIDSITNHLIEY
jgi:hypothetical protein